METSKKKIKDMMREKSHISEDLGKISSNLKLEGQNNVIVFLEIEDIKSLTTKCRTNIIDSISRTIK